MSHVQGPAPSILRLLILVLGPLPFLLPLAFLAEGTAWSAPAGCVVVLLYVLMLLTGPKLWNWYAERAQSRSSSAALPAAETAAHAKRFGPMSVAKMLGTSFLMFIVLRSGAYSRRPQRPVAPPAHRPSGPFWRASQPPLIDRAACTQAYWRVHVSDLHLLRYGDPKIPAEPAPAFRRRWLASYEATFNYANFTSEQNVDPQLVNVVKRHRVHDQERMALQKRLEAYAREQGISDQRPIGEVIQSVERDFAELTDEQLATLPATGQELFRELCRICAAQMQNYDELILLQATLSERYKPRQFSLPDLTREGY